MEFRIDCKNCEYGRLVCEGDPSEHCECPDCGSASLHMTYYFVETVRVADDSKFRSYDPNLSKTQAKRTRIDIKDGMDWWRDGGKYVYRYQEVNRRNDQYLEVVVDLQSGIVLRDCDEPLSEHKRPKGG